jgi:hypothetical protein
MLRWLQEVSRLGFAVVIPVEQEFCQYPEAGRLILYLIGSNRA